MNARCMVVIVSIVLLATLIQKVQANPNHLEPISPYDFVDADDTLHSYSQAVFASLIGRGRLADLWMMERPSGRSPEYAVIVWCRLGRDPNDPHRSDPKRKEWFVDYVTAKEKIWRSKEIANTGPTAGVRGNMLVPDIRPTEDVERHRIPITESFAHEVQEAWLNTLLLTRYADNSARGIEGTPVEFCCLDLFGATWSPKTGLPAMLTDLGRKLGALARSEEKDREPLVAEAASLARKIAKEAEAEQIKLFGKKMSGESPVRKN